MHGNQVSVVNSVVYTLMGFQEQMRGEGHKNGFMNEEDVAKWITQSRCEENEKRGGE